MTGPYSGTVLSDAIRRPHSVEGETKLLWRADKYVAGLMRKTFHNYLKLHKNLLLTNQFKS